MSVERTMTVSDGTPHHAAQPLQSLLEERYGNKNKSVIVRWKSGAPEEELSPISLGLIVEVASWNGGIATDRLEDHAQSLLTRSLSEVFSGLVCTIFVAVVQVDYSEECLTYFIGGCSSTGTPQRIRTPGTLPAIALCYSIRNNIQFEYLANISSGKIRLLFEGKHTQSSRRVSRAVRTAVDSLADKHHIAVDPGYARGALRIFVAGDRSSVGKSSVCLGVIGSLLRSGYSPDSLAYIKPATQSESVQLIQVFCKRNDITCVPIGPVVYYRGFTRAFLAGETASTEQLLEQAGRAVDRVARGKRVVLVDGVGFPAVGSICGTGNAEVLKACSYPSTAGTRHPMGVVLVGGSGVGAAVDAFNLNATYFSAAGVTVMGGIFNKIAESGYYSLENCRDQVTAYFDKNKTQKRLGRRPFGFLPMFPKLAQNNPMQCVYEYISIFSQHVDIDAIVKAAEHVKTNASLQREHLDSLPSKRQKVGHVPMAPTLRNRDEIEGEAIGAGAAPSA